MHADRAVHAVVDQNHDDRQAVLNGGGEFLPVHQKIAVAGEADDRPFREQALRADRRRQAETHRAGRRAELLLDAAKAQEAADPDREIAGAVGEDSVGRAPPDREHDLAQLHPARIARRLLAPGQIVSARGARFGRPADFRRRLNAFQRSAELRRRRDDAKRGMIVAADLAWRRRGRAPAADAGRESRTAYSFATPPPTFARR